MRNIFGRGNFAGRSPFMAASPASPEEAIRMIDSFRTSIDVERSADASDFEAMVAAGKRRLDMLYEIKNAEAKLAEENKRWETTHMNADSLQAAQQALDNLQAQLGQIGTEIQGYRDAVNAHAAKIQSYWDGIWEIISALPEDQQAGVRASLNTCQVNRSMRGSGICEHGENAMGCKKCQRGRKNKRYPPPPSPFQQMSGMFLGKVSLAEMGQTTTSPVSAPPLPLTPPVVVQQGPTATQIGIGIGVLALAVGLVVFSRGTK